MHLRFPRHLRVFLSNNRTIIALIGCIAAMLPCLLLLAVNLAVAVYSEHQTTPSNAYAEHPPMPHPPPPYVEHSPKYPHSHSSGHFRKPSHHISLPNKTKCASEPSSHSNDKYPTTNPHPHPAKRYPKPPHQPTKTDAYAKNPPTPAPSTYVKHPPKKSYTSSPRKNAQYSPQQSHSHPSGNYSKPTHSVSHSPKTDSYAEYPPISDLKTNMKHRPSPHTNAKYPAKHHHLSVLHPKSPLVSHPPKIESHAKHPLIPASAKYAKHVPKQPPRKSQKAPRVQNHAGRVRFFLRCFVAFQNKYSSYKETNESERFAEARIYI